MIDAVIEEIEKRAKNKVSIIDRKKEQVWYEAPGSELSLVLADGSSLDKSDLEGIRKVYSQEHGDNQEAYCTEFFIQAVEMPSNFIYLLKSGKETVGFSMNSLREYFIAAGEKQCFTENYFADTVIREDARGRGLGTLMNLIRFFDQPTEVIHTVTHNPRIFTNMSTIAELSGYVMFADKPNKFVRELIEGNPFYRKGYVSSAKGLDIANMKIFNYYPDEIRVPLPETEQTKRRFPVTKQQGDCFLTKDVVLIYLVHPSLLQ
jgi:hypothetical protein